MMNIKYRIITKLLISVVLINTTLISTAEDTEVYFKESSSSVTPNVLFIMDVSGSMAEETSSGSGENRLDVMKRAFKSVMASIPENANINVGLTNYGQYGNTDYATAPPFQPYQAHGIKYPIKPIDSEALPVYLDGYGGSTGKYWMPTQNETVRDWLPQMVDRYWHNDNHKLGFTPIVDALYESALYFRGEEVVWGRLGRYGGLHAPSSHPATYDGSLIKHDRELCNTYTPTRLEKPDYSDPDGTLFGFACAPGVVNGVDVGFVENSGMTGSGKHSVGYCQTSESNCSQTHRYHTILTCPDGVPDLASDFPDVIDKLNVLTSSWNPDALDVMCGKEEGYVDGTQRLISCTGSGDNRIPTWPNGEILDLWGGATTENMCNTPGTLHFYKETTEYCDYPICDGGTPTRTYTSPIDESCRPNKNYMVLLSDGLPQYSGTYAGDKNTYTSLGFNEAGFSKPGPTFYKLLDDRSNGVSGIAQDFDASTCATAPNGYPSGRCGPELTKFLSETDNIDDSILADKQTIDTMVVGYSIENKPDAVDYLKSLVTVHDDPNTPDKTEKGYFSADNESQLVSALNNAVTQITTGAQTTTLASPGYSVSIKTGLSHENFVYIPVFEKSLLAAWSGNLKKFKISEVTSADGSKQRKIQGKNNIDAVTELGAFTADALDLWSTSTTPDGLSVPKGGVASQLDPVDRNLYSDLNCSVNCDLTATNNQLVMSNIGSGSGKLNHSTLNVPTALSYNYIKNLTCYIGGYEEYDLATGDCSGNRHHIGDILHSEPVIVTYNKNYATSTKKQVVFVGTNEGYLHAFDSVSGEEIFAYMPKELLSNIHPQFVNNDIGGHPYGIDGAISVWYNDENEDGVISGSDHVYLYFGLRRGGDAYYALDVTNVDEPKLLWKLDSSTSGFSKLGQSWARPYIAKIREGSGATDFREVVIFSGGYDTNQDLYADSSKNPYIDPSNKPLGKKSKQSNDSIGNDIFIVDAKTGASGFSWSMQGSASNAGALKHSVPGGVRILDMNRDGAIDRMYFADMVGNVWRLELPPHGLSGSKLIKFAELPGVNSEKRKFYNEPDVALLKHKGKSYLSVSIGSGYRSHPLDKVVDDAFFVLIDKAVYLNLETDTTKTDHFETIKVGDLAKVTMSVSSTVTVDRSTLGGKSILDVTNKKGWYLDLPTVGEKVLASSLTRNGNVSFTTLSPDAKNDADVCALPTSLGRYYSFDLLTSEAVSDLSGDVVISDSDIMIAVSENEIPASPQNVYNEPVCSAGKCSHDVDTRIGKKASQISTSAANYLEPVYWSDPVIQ